ncbi:C-X-C motif chemokine 11-6 [Ictalurus punctatus]|uniref:C-X-C motif chemokine 11-6 n=1 Tax=Ictalurus punctatus TaxID=7998 RepID=A0A1L2IW26_ICTPU|nr:C-X-C motif chemokine 11-6 [Ictalurus punctatus]AOR81883.1 chemokine CXCL11.2 [Ictalurus punctatus]ARD08888.1 chemokine (C-C motif) ligand 34a, duplicate 2 protein [Ictalurus punctatus]
MLIHSPLHATGFWRKINRILRESTPCKIKKKMKSAAVFLAVACLLLVYVQGLPRINSRRCLCQGPVVNAVRLQRIDKIELYPASATCQKVEIIVTLKSGAGQKCLNPESEFTQTYITKAIKKRNAE